MWMLLAVRARRCRRAGTCGTTSPPVPRPPSRCCPRRRCWSSCRRCCWRCGSTASRDTRKPSRCAGFAAGLVLVGVSYPLFALLKGELFPGAGPRLAHRRMAVPDDRTAARAHPRRRAPARTRAARPGSTTTGCCRWAAGRRARSALVGPPAAGPAVAVAHPALVAMRPGGYLPAMYVIQALPFLALVLAGGTEVASARLRAVRPARRATSAPLLGARAGARWPSRPAAVVLPRWYWRRNAARSPPTPTPRTAAAADWLATRPRSSPSPGRASTTRSGWTWCTPASPGARDLVLQGRPRPGGDEDAARTAGGTSTTSSSSPAVRPTRSTCPPWPRWSTPTVVATLRHRRGPDRDPPDRQGGSRDHRRSAKRSRRGSRPSGSARAAPRRTDPAPSPSSSRPSTSATTSPSCCAGSPSGAAGCSEVVFVDDSTDDTPEVIAAAAQDCPFPVTVHHRDRSGRARRRGRRGPAAGPGRLDRRHGRRPAAPAGAACRNWSPPATRRAPSSSSPAGTSAAAAAPGSPAATAWPCPRSSTWLTKVAFPRRLRGVSDPMSGFFAVRAAAFDVDGCRPLGYKILLELARPVPAGAGRRGAVRVPGPVRGRVQVEPSGRGCASCATSRRCAAASAPATRDARPSAADRRRPASLPEPARRWGC